MINKFKNLGRLKITILLVVMTLFSFGISITRYFITDSKLFLFLNWNLFLAFIPWMISTILIYKNTNRKSSLILLITSWLLFFPNSPYILTDLFHLRLHTSAPMWFDLIVILSFAWTGLIYGFISLLDIETLLKRYINGKIITIISVIFLFLASFGIYLGRFLRWNSWDIISNPFGLFNDVFERIINPFDHPRTWGLTILMGILLNMMYFSLKFIKEQK
jgi:uncharacterized membrane protein